MANSNELEMHDPAFMDAFNEGEAEAEPGGMDLEGAEEREEGAADNPAEEAAEGAGGEEAAEAAGPEGAPAAVVVIAEAEPAEGTTVTPSAEVAEEPTEGEEEAAAQASGKPVTQSTRDDPYDLSDVPAEDQQKAKSWAGRLKKMEADLKAREAALAKPAGGEQQAAAALESAASEGGEKAAAAAELQQQVDAGEISAADAVKMLSEDFGDDFVRMVSAVAKGAVGKQGAPAQNEELAQTKAELEALRNQATRDHFEAISEAHPDFVQVYEDPAFRQWASANGKDKIVQAGSARQINKMLEQYKAAKPAAAAPAQDAVKAAAQAAPAKAAPARVDQAALDAAEGVRGSGVRLPEKPSRASDDFASAFDEF